MNNMAKEKHVRIRRITHKALKDTAEKVGLTVGELADRVLSDFVEKCKKG
jgi:hypothetical protein